MDFNSYNGKGDEDLIKGHYKIKSILLMDILKIVLIYVCIS